MLIRTTTATDAEALRALRIEALTNHPTSFSSSPDDVDKFDWTERAATGQGSGLEAIFVAEHESKLVAMAGIIASARKKSTHSAMIWGVYVLPEFRGQKLGQKIVNAAVQWATAKRLTIVRLGATATNPASMQCYLHCGFSIYGVDPAAMVVDGVEYDEILMYKRLPCEK